MILFPLGVAAVWSSSLEAAAVLLSFMLGVLLASLRVITDPSTDGLSADPLGFGSLTDCCLMTAVSLTGVDVAGLCAADAAGLILAAGLIVSFDRSSLAIASAAEDLAFSDKR